MKVTCFGEVLWDVFPTYKKIGGAPLNVALRLHSLGINTSIITRVGADKPGEEIEHYIKNQGLTIDKIQKDCEYSTGEVMITLDKAGVASYKISSPVAWDFIKLNDDAIKEVQESDAIIFGSLACRNKTSRNTLFQLLENARVKILDVNLRPPYYDFQLLLELMKKADFIKLNDEELEEICIHLGIPKTTIRDQIKELSNHTSTNVICITKGEKGATLFYRDLFYKNDGYKVKVVDAVGAGDSFLATLISQLLQNNNPQKSIDYACAIGAMVAGSAGANPTFSEEEIKKFIGSN